MNPPSLDEQGLVQVQLLLSVQQWRLVIQVVIQSPCFLHGTPCSRGFRHLISPQNKPTGGLGESSHLAFCMGWKTNFQSTPQVSTPQLLLVPCSPQCPQSLDRAKISQLALAPSHSIPLCGHMVFRCLSAHDTFTCFPASKNLLTVFIFCQLFGGLILFDLIGLSLFYALSHILVGMRKKL